MDPSLLQLYKEWTQELLKTPPSDFVFGVRRDVAVLALKTLALELLPTVSIEENEPIFLKNFLAAVQVIPKKLSPTPAPLEVLVKEWEEAKARSEEEHVPIESDRRFKKRQDKFSRLLKRDYQKRARASFERDVSETIEGLTTNLFATVERGRAVLEDAILTLPIREKDEMLAAIASEVSENVKDKFPKLTRADMPEGLAHIVISELEGSLSKSLTQPSLMVALRDALEKESNTLAASFSAARNVTRVYEEVGGDRLSALASSYFGDSEKLGLLGEQIHALLVQETKASSPAQIARSLEIAKTTQNKLWEEALQNPSLGSDPSKVSSSVKSAILSDRRSFELMQPEGVYRVADRFAKDVPPTAFHLARLKYLSRLSPFSNAFIASGHIEDVDSGPFPYLLLSLPKGPSGLVKAPAAFALGAALNSAAAFNENTKEGLLLSLLGLSDLETVRKRIEDNASLSDSEKRAHLTLISKVDRFTKEHKRLNGVLRNYWRLTNLRELLVGPPTAGNERFTNLSEQLIALSGKKFSSKPSFYTNPAFARISLYLTNLFKSRLFGFDAVFENGSFKVLPIPILRAKVFLAKRVFPKTAFSINIAILKRLGVVKKAGLGRLLGGALSSFIRVASSFFGISRATVAGVGFGSALGFLFGGQPGGLVGGIVGGGIGSLTQGGLLGPAANLLRGFLGGLRGMFFIGRAAIAPLALFANPLSGSVIIAIAVVALLALFIVGFAPPPGGPPGPGPTPLPTLPPGVASGCPIPSGGINCGSYGSPDELNTGICSRGSDGSTGHCSQKYVAANPGLCNPLRDAQGTLIRTAKGIDVPSAPGSPVYLPTIGGNAVDWYYIGAAGPSFGGYYRMFKTEDLGSGVWFLYFFHVEKDNPPLPKNTPLRSGAVAAKIYNMNGPHVHVNIGFDVKNFGSNDKFDPGWKHPDIELGMCTSSTNP